MVHDSYETWKQVPGFEGYYASDKGYVIGPSGKPLQPYWSACRNPPAKDRLDVRVNGVRKQQYVYRMVAMAFHGPAPSNQHVVHHINHNHNDNRPENLEWMHTRDHAALHQRLNHARRQAAGDF